MSIILWSAGGGGSELGSEGGGHLVLRVLDLVIMAIIARTDGCLGPLLPPTRWPLTDLALNLRQPTHCTVKYLVKN